MGLIKKGILFVIGGLAYVTIELLWRGWSHVSMFLAGGTCFLLLGKLNSVQPRLPLVPRLLVGSGIITMVELAAGLLFNRDHSIWNYSHMPLNFCGQICLPFTLLWIPMGAAAMALYDRLSRRFQH